MLVAAAIIALVAPTATAQPAGTFTVLHAFGATDGTFPVSVLQATDGNFYGTTASGGPTPSSGTVFRMTPAGTVTVLHAFPGGMDGADPIAIIQSTDGNFYGSMSFGGNAGCHLSGQGLVWGCGTIFKMTPSGTVTVLHAFAGGTDGAKPSSLIHATDGNFYGSTSFDGAGSGTVFRMAPAGEVTVLHTFLGTDGAETSSLIQATDGNLYGTTISGGTSSGVVFELTIGGAPAITTQPQS